MRRFAWVGVALLLAVPGLRALEVGDEAPELVFDTVNDEEAEYNLNEVSEGTFGVCFVDLEALTEQDENAIAMLARLEALVTEAAKAEADLHIVVIVVGPAEARDPVVAAWKEHELNLPVAVLTPEQVAEWELPDDTNIVMYAVAENKVHDAVTTDEELAERLKAEG